MEARGAWGQSGKWLFRGAPTLRDAHRERILGKGFVWQQSSRAVGKGAPCEAKGNEPRHFVVGAAERGWREALRPRAASIHVIRCDACMFDSPRFRCKDFFQSLPRSGACDGFGMVLQKTRESRLLHAVLSADCSFSFGFSLAQMFDFYTTLKQVGLPSLLQKHILVHHSSCQ